VRLMYFPGCTLQTKASGFNCSVKQTAGALGVELVELAGWNCCGATFPLLVDNMLGMAGPARNLALTAEAGSDTLVTACATCFNVLRRTSYRLKTDADALDKINFFLERPAPYAGQVVVRHLLDVLVNDVGTEAMAARAAPGLSGLRVASYYGCMLLRPAGEIGLDDPERPQLMDRLFAACGAQSVEYPHAGECCGAYLAVHKPEAAAEISLRILSAAGRAGAQVVATACPLCQFNLDRAQARLGHKATSFQKIPVLYFTQLLGLAFGLEPAGYQFEAHYVDPRPILRSAGLFPSHPVQRGAA